MTTLKLALRSLLKSPGFAAIAILTLALGIGANTAMFSLLNTLLLQPVRLDQPDRLMQLYRSTGQDPEGGFSPADFLNLPATEADFGTIAASAGVRMSLSEPGQAAELVRGTRVSANFFPTLGIVPALGRDFRPEEQLLGNHHVLILSHGFWRDRFASDPGVIGRTVRVDGALHEIIGVLPAEFSDRRLFGRSNLFRPLGLTDEEQSDRTATWLNLLGRRGTHVDAVRAATFIANLGHQLAIDHPAANAGATWRAVPLIESFMDPAERGIVTMLIGLSSFVLLIACSNLANLLLARTIARSREFAVRSALGASRAQLLRPLIAESLLLAGIGGVGALFIARWTGDWIASLVQAVGDETFVMNLDWRVLGFATVASVVTALAFGLAPALFALRLNLNDTLKSGARGSTGGRGVRRLGQLLIVGQFGLALVLLAGAGMFLRGSQSAMERHFGWNANDMLSGVILLPAGNYPESAQITAFQTQLLERVTALPGVDTASLSNTLPALGLSGPHPFVIEGREAPPRGQEPSALVNGITPDYFNTVGTPLLSGRTFTSADTVDAPKVVVINEAMARAFFGEQNPLGRRIGRAGGDEVEWREIVGVAADTESVFSEDTSIPFAIYHPMAQEAAHYNWLAVRTRGVAPSTLVEPLRRTLGELNPDLPITNLMPTVDLVDRATTDFKLINTLLTAFALLGVALAALGIYGVIARTVALRTGEFGVRMALGSPVSGIIALVLRAGLRLALFGIGVGLLGAYGLSRALNAVLPTLQLDTGPVLTAVTVALLLIGLLACYLPARRAARINPIDALRND